MIEEIISDFKELIIWINNWWFYRKQSVKMDFAIKLADMKQKAFNKRCHVMLLEIRGKDKLVSVTNKDIEKFKRKGWLPKKLGMIELQDSIFYSTPLSRNNCSTLEERKIAKKKYIKYAKRYTMK